MLYVLSCSLIVCVLSSPSWIEHYLTNGIHRKLTGNNSAVYFTFAHPRSLVEVKKNLLWILDPCGDHEGIVMGNRTVACGDSLMKEFVGNDSLVEELCHRRYKEIKQNGNHTGFEVLWIGEKACNCMKKCSDGTRIDKWPACSCYGTTTIGFKTMACDFESQCDWTYQGMGFNVSTRIPKKHHFVLAYAIVENSSVPSKMFSPFYAQFTSSCTLSFFYNLAGTNQAEIRIFLEWRKYPGQSAAADNVLISKLSVHQENSHVLDYHEVRIGFVTKHARIRIECVLPNGVGKAICKFNNLTWNNCAERDGIYSPCHGQNNPTLCSKDGRMQCLTDVTCDGVKDCPNGEDEANCDFVDHPGTKCNFENATGMCGWEEKAYPLRRDGKKLFIRGKLHPNMTIEDTSGRLLDSGVMKETPRSNSSYFLLVSGKREATLDSGEYYLESPLFPPTRQFTGDAFRPEAVCTARFRYCVKGSEQLFYLELEKRAYLPKDVRLNISPLWEPTEVADYDVGAKCDWHLASVKIPRQVLPFRLRFRVKLMSKDRLSFMAIDDFSLNPSCFDYNSHTIVNANQTYATCGKTGTDIPSYDDCKREAVLTGVPEVEHYPDGSRSLSIVKDGLYWVKICGAGGGEFPFTPGGRGNCIVGVMHLHEGNQLKFILGQKGTSPCGSTGPTDTLSLRQERIFKHVCGFDNSTITENIDPAFYIGAGGGGLSALFLPDGLPAIVAGGGGGAFPAIFKPRRYSPSINGNGMTLKPHQGPLECDSECAEATPKRIEEQGSCYKKVPFETQGGYGGGGTSCGTGGGGGGGYFGGKYGRFSYGVAGSDFVAESIASGIVGYHKSENSGDGSLVLVRCSLECRNPSYCDFISVDGPEMACGCGPGRVIINDTCVQRVLKQKSAPQSSLEEEHVLVEPVSNQFVLIIFLFFLAVFLVFMLMVRYNYTCFKVLGKKHFMKENKNKPDDGVELLDFNQADVLEKLFANQPFIKNLPSKNLLMLLNKIDDNDLKILEPIGQGAFGNVSRGELKESDGHSRDVAVKVLNNEWSSETESATRNFITEALLMSLSNNVGKATIQLIGVVLDRRPYKIVMELMKGGNLLNFLRSSRPNDISDNPNNLTMRDLIQFAKDIVEGCLILERNHHLHRDLAARNCLLTKLGPGRRVKIGDFGLATELYHTGEYVSRARHRPIPLKWMPPEAIQDGIFSTKTDVWSFGVVCWEIFTIGQIPYPTVPTDYLYDILAQGKRLARPKGCPTEIYDDIMLECWQPHPEKRPTFAQLDEKLSQLIIDQSITGQPIPLVHGLEKVSSPVLEDPVFPNMEPYAVTPIYSGEQMVGTPVTIETALPTPLTTEDHWNNPDKTSSIESAPTRQATPATDQQTIYENPLPLNITFQINNNSYWKGCGAPNPERPTQLPLMGSKFRECRF